MRSWRCTFSMKKKLLLMLVGMAFVTYFLLAFILKFAIERHFLNQDYNYIVSKFNAIENTLLSSPQAVFDQSKNMPLYMWVFDKEKVIYKNSNLTFPSAQSFTPTAPNILKRKNEIEWREDSLAIRAFAFKSERYVVVLGMSINHHIVFLEELAWILFWTLGTAFVASSVYSWWVVKKGLKPIASLNQHIQQVTPEQLDLRLPVESLPTELQDLARKHNAMLDRLQLGFQRLSDFSSDIAHELKTPLTNVMTQNQVMLGAARSEDEYQDALASTLEELNRITKTINDLLYIAKAENKLIHRNDEYFSVKAQIERLVDYYDILAEEASLTMTCQGDATLYMDKNMFERAVGNLLSNAIRHAYAGTCIELSVQERDNQVLITVANQGDTIADENLPYLFDRFYRADKSRVHRGSVGAGLGLSITQSIIHAYGGTVSVSSERSLTRFEITLASASDDSKQ